MRRKAGAFHHFITPAGRTASRFGYIARPRPPQAWIRVPRQQTGTAAVLALSIANTRPGAGCRTGVRAP